MLVLVYFLFLAVAAALDKCSATASGQDAEREAAEEARSEMEASQSSLALQCSDMLKVVE